jgi:hypothetical protein
MYLFNRRGISQAYTRVSTSSKTGGNARHDGEQEEEEEDVNETTPSAGELTSTRSSQGATITQRRRRPRVKKPLAINILSLSLSLRRVWFRITTSSCATTARTIRDANQMAAEMADYVPGKSIRERRETPSI